MDGWVIGGKHQNQRERIRRGRVETVLDEVARE